MKTKNVVLIFAALGISQIYSIKDGKPTLLIGNKAEDAKVVYAIF